MDIEPQSNALEQVDDIRAPDFTMETEEELQRLHEERQANRRKAGKILDEERQKRLEEITNQQAEDNAERQKNMDRSITAMEQERTRRMSEDMNHDAKLAAERKLNRDRSIRAMEDERNRRIAVEEDHEAELEAQRQANIDISIAAMENERARRIAEELSRQVKEDLLKEQRIKTAITLAEEERRRRIELEEECRREDLEERKRNKALAIRVMEEERVRRIKSPEHKQKMEVLSPRSFAESAGEHMAEVMHECDHYIAKFEEVAEEEEEVEADSGLRDVQLNIADPVVNNLPVESRRPEEETSALCELRKELEVELSEAPQFEELVGDVRLLRYLRGHNLDVQVAAKIFRATLKWRHENNINSIREEIVTKNLKTEQFPGYEKIIKYISFVNIYDRFDRDGNVIAYERTGYIDTVGVMENISEEEWSLFYFYQMEYRSILLDRLSRERRQLTGVTLIRDLEGLSLIRASPAILDRLHNLLKVVSANYPETMGAIYIINTPWMFHTIWSIIKLWFDKRQLKKIQLLRKNYQQVLHDAINKDALPPLLGGQNKSVEIPETGLLAQTPYEQLLNSGGTEIDLRAGGTIQLPFNLKPNETIYWEFDVRDYDIKFGVNIRKQGDGGAVEEKVVMPEKFTYGSIHAGSWSAEEPCTAVLIWDNSFSWTRRKLVCYRTSVFVEEGAAPTPTD